MNLTLLTAPACPYAEVFERRLAAAPARGPHAVVRRREIADSKRPPGPVLVHCLITSRARLPSSRRRCVRWPAALCPASSPRG